MSEYVTGRVSVIIPSYNRGKYLRQTIESVLDQTYPDVELFVVDDGSTDDSLDIARSYGNRLFVLQHPNGENRGQSASINRGLDAATGEFVAILDSDDYWMLDKLEKQVVFLESNPDIGLVYGNCYYVDAKGEILYRLYGDDYAERNVPGSVLLDCYFLLPNNSLVRHEVIDLAGKFNESYRAAQDHDMAVRIAEVTKLGYIPDILFCYRRHDDSISKNGTETRWNNGFKILASANERFAYPRRVLRKRRALLHFRLAQCRLSQKRYLGAVPHLFTAAILDPARSFGVLLGREQVSPPSC